MSATRVTALDFVGQDWLKDFDGWVEPQKVLERNLNLLLTRLRDGDDSSVGLEDQFAGIVLACAGIARDPNLNRKIAIIDGGCSARKQGLKPDEEQRSIDLLLVNRERLFTPNESLLPEHVFAKVEVKLGAQVNGEGVCGKCSKLTDHDVYRSQMHCYRTCVYPDLGEVPCIAITPDSGIKWPVSQRRIDIGEFQAVDLKDQEEAKKAWKTVHWSDVIADCKKHATPEVQKFGEYLDLKLSNIL